MQILNNATTIPDSIDWCFHSLTEVGKCNSECLRGAFSELYCTDLLCISIPSCATVLNKSIFRNKDIGFHLMKKRHQKRNIFKS